MYRNVACAGWNIRQLLVWVMLCGALIMAACGKVSGAEGDAAANFDSWKTKTTYELGSRATVITEPGADDTAIQLAEIVFEMPYGLVDLQKVTDGFISSLDLTVERAIPISQRVGAYQRSFIARKKGEDISAHVDVIALEEPTRQRILLVAGPPQKIDRLGGRAILLERFAGGKSLEALTRDMARRRALLDGRPDDHVITTSSGGVRFTQEHFKVAVEVVEFMAGRKMSGTDIEWLLSNAADDWEKAPDLGQIDNVRGFLGQARVADPLKRLDMATALYALSRKGARETGESSSLLEMVERLNPVLAEKGGDILTQRALEARLRSARIVMQLDGKSAREISGAQDALRQEIISSFTRAPEFRRKAMQAAQSRGLRLLAMMASTAPDQRREKLNEAISSAGSNPSTLAVAHALEEPRTRAIGGITLDQYNEYMEQVLFSAVVLPAF